MKSMATRATSHLWCYDEMSPFPQLIAAPKNRKGQQCAQCLGWLSLRVCEGSCTPAGQCWGQCCSHRNIRVAVLPCSESTSCLFRTRPVEASDNLVYNEVFWVSISYPALRQKTLRVDVCTVDKSHLEECLVSIQLYFNNFVFVSSF